jgi:hypothetical protein
MFLSPRFAAGLGHRCLLRPHPPLRSKARRNRSGGCTGSIIDAYKRGCQGAGAARIQIQYGACLNPHGFKFNMARVESSASFDRQADDSMSQSPMNECLSFNSLLSNL